jgi:hypothetical protein
MAIIMLILDVTVTAPIIIDIAILAVPIVLVVVVASTVVSITAVDVFLLTANITRDSRCGPTKIRLCDLTQQRKLSCNIGPQVSMSTPIKHCCTKGDRAFERCSFPCDVL